MITFHPEDAMYASFFISVCLLGCVFIYALTKLILFFVYKYNQKKEEKTKLNAEQIQAILNEIEKQEQIIKNYGGHTEAIKKAIERINELQAQLDKVQKK